MQTFCGHCGKAMIQGRVVSTGGLLDDLQLSFVVSSGTPTSLNPLTAVVQGMHDEPAYREEVCPIRGRLCPGCGRFEFCIDAADLTRVNSLGGPPVTE
jgi:hypothetical protein